LQDRWREGTFTCTLLSSDIAIVFLYHTRQGDHEGLLVYVEEFSMLQCPAGLLIRVQPNTYIEKTEHLWTALHLVKERGQLNKGYNTQVVWEIQLNFASIYCVVSGLCDKWHWQDFPSNWSIIKELVKCKTKQSCLRTFSTSRGPHLILGARVAIRNRARSSGKGNLQMIQKLRIFY
jgi:hypothetical protein